MKDEPHCRHPRSVSLQSQGSQPDLVARRKPDPVDFRHQPSHLPAWYIEWKDLKGEQKKKKS
jgi:hypothetical protein